jgi:hypothetical protein
LIKRDNHYVPDSYLKRWANVQGKVLTYRVLVPHQNTYEWKPHSPKGIGYHEHLYTRMAVGGETDDIETWFETEFETPAARPLQQAVTDQQLSAEDWRRLIRFLAAQDVRTPAQLVAQLKRWNETLPSLINEVAAEAVQKLEVAKRAGIPFPTPDPLENGELFPVRTVIEANADKDGGMLRVEATIGRSMWLWSLKHVLNRTLDVLNNHCWTILRSPPGIEWLTSDNPVVRLNYRDAEHYDFKGGWASPGTVIFMPLSPTHLMYTQVGVKPQLPIGTFAPVELATQIQRFTVEHAHRYVFGRTADPQVGLWRPRTVDSKAFYAEAEQWKSWNPEQSEAERSLLKHRTT